MEFRIGGVQFEVSGAYLLAALAMLVAISIPIGVILFGIVPNAGSVGDKSFDAYYSAITGIFSVIAEPVIAAAFILGIGVFKLKKDERSCASMAASGFVAYAALTAVIFALAVQSAPSTFSKDALGLISVLVQTAASSVVIYLWMLVFLRKEKDRLASVIPFALAVAVIVFLSGRGFLYALSYAKGTPFMLGLDLAAASIVVKWLLTAAAVLYTTRGRKLDMDAAYTYSAFVLADAVIYGLVDQNLVFLGNLSRLAVLVEAAFALALLYLFSRGKEPARKKPSDQ